MRTFSRHTRAEGLVAKARIALVAVAAVALYIDPSGPPELRTLTRALLAIYGVYALVSVLAARRADVIRWRVVSHAVDFIAVGALNFVTYGPNSPLFVFFFFLLFCSTARFDWRATVWTAAGALLLYSAMGYYFGFVLEHPEFELGRFVVRIVYLAAIGSALIYLDAYRERLQQDVRGLAEWPRHVPTRLDAAARELITHAAAELRVTRAAIFWVDVEDDERYAAELDGEVFSFTDSQSDGHDLVAPALVSRSFYCKDTKEAIVIDVDTDDVPVVVRTEVLTAGFVERYGAGPVLSTPFTGKTARGRLFYFGSSFSGEDLVVGAIVAGLIATSLDQYHLSWQIGESAREEERLRVAGDLHTGVLQTLAASGVQLHLAERAIDSDPEEAREVLRELQDSLVRAQREVRELFADRDRTTVDDESGS